MTINWQRFNCFLRSLYSSRKTYQYVFSKHVSSCSLATASATKMRRISVHPHDCQSSPNIVPCRFCTNGLRYIILHKYTSTRKRRIRLSDHGFIVFQGTDTSVLQHQGPLLTSGAVIGIVVATIFIVFIIIDAIFCCVRKTGEPALNHSPNRFSLPLCMQREHTRVFDYSCCQLCMIAPIMIIIFVVNYLLVAHCDSIASLRY